MESHVFTESELQKYNRAQIEEILRYKWIESEKVGHDIGEVRAAYEWVGKYAKAYREAYREAYMQEPRD